MNTDEKKGSQTVQVKNLKVLTKENRNDFIDYRACHDCNNGLLRTSPCRIRKQQKCAPTKEIRSHCRFCSSLIIKPTPALSLSGFGIQRGEHFQMVFITFGLLASALVYRRASANQTPPPIRQTPLAISAMRTLGRVSQLPAFPAKTA